jgi:hypothetical protein
MKVDDPRTHFNLPVISATAVQSPPEPNGFGALSGPNEAVSLSSDLRLADEAVRAAAPGDGVREHAVERARALLASGELGRDLERLAERLIDSLIESRDA